MEDRTMNDLWENGQGDRADESDQAYRADQCDRAYPADLAEGADGVHLADMVAEPAGPYRRLRVSGGYRSLKSFQTTTLIYDATLRFCDKWIPIGSRTHDQMVQAARSGQQNIAEGSRAGATSGRSEIHLSNVARASLEELLLDYEDYLRQRGLPQWEKDDPQALEIRQLARKAGEATQSLGEASHRKQDDARMAVYSPWLMSEDSVKVANTLICMIHQANYLLDQRAAELEQSIIQDGGYREQLTAARLAQRGNAQPEKGPLCPDCGGVMRLRTAKAGPHAGNQFWGCEKYPECKKILPYDPPDGADNKEAL